jgi:hypothetical protein
MLTSESFLLIVLCISLSLSYLYHVFYMFIIICVCVCKSVASLEIYIGYKLGTFPALKIRSLCSLQEEGF